MFYEKDQIEIKLNYVHTVECSKCGFIDEWKSPIAFDMGLFAIMIEHGHLCCFNSVTCQIYDNDTDAIVFKY